MSKIAIVNRTNLINYGSVLQCYALYRFVGKLGYECRVIWEKGTISQNRDYRLKKIVVTVAKMLCRPSLWKQTFALVNSVRHDVVNEVVVGKFEKFVNENIETIFFDSKELKKVAYSNEYDWFICGSDQVWCSTSLYVDPLMYLRFVPQEKRIAYAPSLGRDYIPGFNKRVMRRYINAIPRLSVREDVGQKLIKELTGRDAVVVLDPTLLLSQDDWNDIKKDPKNKKYMLCYFLSVPTEEIQKQLIKIAKQKKLSVLVLYTKLPILDKTIEVVYPQCGPSEFIGYISEAEYIFTDSYHGTIFSIIYQRDFCSIERMTREFDQSSRQISLLSRLGLKSRYINGICGEIITEPIDYEKVNFLLENEKCYSVEYLRKALEER